MCINEILPYVTLGKELVVAGVAGAGVWFAHQGLSTWRRQLKGTHEFELARRLVVDTYKMRQAIQNVRTPRFFVREAPPPERNAAPGSDEHNRFLTEMRGYEKLWAEINEAKSVLTADLLEAEALWESSFTEKFDELWICVNDLQNYFRLYLSTLNPNLPSDIRKAHFETLNKKPDILHAYSDEAEPDQFSLKVSAAVSRIEESLKPYLKQ